MRLLLALGWLFIPSSLWAGTRLELYPPTPGLALEQRLAVIVQDRPLPLVNRRVWHSDSSGKYFMEVAAARFAADGPAQLSLSTQSGSLGRPVLRTVGRDIPAKSSGAVLAFEIPAPGHYYLQLPGLARSNCTFTVAFWVDDLRQVRQMRRQFAADGAVDVTRHGIRADPALDQTSAIQALLDRGGKISFPPGMYRSGSLRLRSDTTIYLAPGAVLRAVDREDAVGPEFIAIDNARNVKLCGQGTLDANSLARHRRHNVHHVNITSSRDVTLEDLLFEESNSWAIHIRKSDRFTARNLKVFSGKDGFDPDASRDVLIDGAFVVSADDAIAVKNRFPDDVDGKVTERVIFRNSLVSTHKSALKIGTETRGPIRDVTFENCDVFDGDRGIVLYARDGGPVERVVWRQIRLQMIDWPQEKESGAVFHIIVDRREGATPVRECLIENVTANWIYRSEFAGLPDAPLTGLKLRDVSVRAGRPKADKPWLFECRDHVRVPIEGLTIDWQGNRDQWAGIASGKGLIISEATASPRRGPTTGGTSGKP